MTRRAIRRRRWRRAKLAMLPIGVAAAWALIWAAMDLVLFEGNLLR